MSEFFSSLSYSALALMLVAGFSAVTPALGAMLAIRNETMLALALPSIASAAMALGLSCGLNAHQTIALYGLAALATLLSIYAASRLDERDSGRALFLAAMLVGGQLLSATFAALSTNAHHHARHLLDGEILTVGPFQTTLQLSICGVLLVGGFFKAGLLYSWCADREFFRIGSSRFALFQFTVYCAFATIITLGVATMGALLVTALLVLPALFGTKGRAGIARYLLRTTTIGILGSMGGFLTALALDFPPAISAGLGIGVVGSILRLCGAKK